MESISQLTTLADTAATNVKAAVGSIDPAVLKAIETKTAAEINRIENQLSLMLADVQNSYEKDLAQVKSVYSYAKTNWHVLLASHVAATGLGALLLHFL